MIEVRNLTKSFGVMYALRGIDLEIPDGAFLSIFGPNGAGKSTFLRILATLSRATGGEILLGGEKINKDAVEFRRKLGVIGHATFLYDELTALENLQFYASMFDLAASRERIARVLSDVGLQARQSDRVRSFSRGMQQRLSIARAMLHDPKILLLDEPYTGLDQHAANMLTNWLGTLKKASRTIIMATHELAGGFSLADEAAIFLKGKLVFRTKTADMTVAQFRENYFRLVDASGAGE